jgi:hypothetical protein
MKTLISILLKEQRFWNEDEQKLYHTVLLPEVQRRKGHTEQRDRREGAHLALGVSSSQKR